MDQIDDKLALTLIGGFESEFLLSVLNASQDCVKLIEPSGALAYMNENGLCAMDIDRFDDVAGRPWPELWPDQLRATVDAALDQARRGKRTSFEAEGRTAKDRVKWWHVSVLPIRDAQGDVYKILASSRDITERVLREREQVAYAKTLEQELAEKSTLLIQRDFLMREVDHRVKNSLSQVASILRLQARRSSDVVRPALDEAARRVAAIARVHEHLQSSSDFRSIPTVPLLQRLCGEFTLSFDREIRFTAQGGDDMPMLSERASALCIILSELVANAVRHGSGDAPVLVTLDRSGPGATLRVCNDAHPSPAPKAAPDPATGLGKLICETYAATLSGRLDWQTTAGEAAPGQRAEGQMTATLEFIPAA